MSCALPTRRRCAQRTFPANAKINLNFPIKARSLTFTRVALRPYAGWTMLCAITGTNIKLQLKKHERTSWLLILLYDFMFMTSPTSLDHDLLGG
jgi:hypothetical protein